VFAAWKNTFEDRIFAFAALLKGCAAANDRVFCPCNKYLAVLSMQYNTTSIDFIQFSADGHYGWGILGYSIGISKKHQPFPMARLYVGVSGDGQ